MKKFDLSKAAIIISSSATVCESAARILRDEIAARTRLRLKVAEAPPAANVPAIVLGTVGDLPGGPYSRPNGPRVPSRAEGYAIWIDRKTREAPTVCLAGRDDRGTLFAAGRLLRLMVMARDRLTLAGDTRIASAPRYPLRGHQLAYRPKTNSYDGWTVPMWEQYMRDLVVFGANAVELLPPHTDDEPDSPLFPLPPMEMMIEMSRAAERYGLDVWVWYPIMAGLDSLGGGIRGGKCIDDTKEVHRYLKEWEDVFRQLPRLNAVLVPGGDPGDRQGAKPFMAFVEKAAGVLRRHHPDAQMWVSVQAREHRLKAFLDTVRKRPDWLDGIVRGPDVRSVRPLSGAPSRSGIPSGSTRISPTVSVASTRCRTGTSLTS